MIRSTFIYVICFLLIIWQSTNADCPQWTYDILQNNGPLHWGDLCPDYINCKTGLAQSPIDLVDETQVEGEMKSLQYSYHPVHNFTLLNTRYTIEGTDLGDKNTLSFVGLHTYTLTEFHFHSPSEHRINGQQFDLEIHYLHNDGKGNYATLALFFQGKEGAPTSWFLQMIAVLLPDIPVDGDSVPVPSIDIATQINVTGGYYHYEGSTTTPPCQSGVQWFVAKDPIFVDSGVLSKFTTTRNSRPVQPSNSRVPVLYVIGNTANVDKWVWAIGIAGLGVLGVLILLGLIRYAYRLHNAKKYENQQELAGFLGSTNNETL